MVGCAGGARRLRPNGPRKVLVVINLRRSWALTTCAAVISTSLVTGAPIGHAKNRDTHIISQASVQTIDCNDATLIVNGADNVINALGTCWAVTTMGSSNVVIADTIVNDITAYGWDQTVYFHNGDPFIWDRGREVGMTNRLMRVPV